MIVSKTPLRMSFFGGGSDLANYFQNTEIGYGSVVSTAINMYIYITINKRRDNKIRIVYYGNELVDSVDEIKHDIIRNALKFLNIEGGLEIFYSSEISISNAGLGLSSSSALTVGVLNALHAFKGEEVSPLQLAKEAYHIERDLNGQPCGIQDQLAVAFGGFRKYRFYADWTLTAEKVPCDPKNIQALKDNLLLFYVGVNSGKRNSFKILKEQQDANNSNQKKIDELVRAVDRNVNYLINGDIDSWGEEFDKAWQIKKTFSKDVTTPEIDELYDRIKRLGGLGGKILGAGGGGFLLAYVPKEARENVLNNVKDYELIDFEFEEKGSQLIYI